MPGKAYVTRLIIPILQTLINTGEVYKSRYSEHLKYIGIHTESIAINNLLRFLGYWETFGYEKYARFSSSVRIELLVHKAASDNDKMFYVQFIYDDDIIEFPWCKNSYEKYCSLNDFIEYTAANVILDFQYVGKFCMAEEGRDYISGVDNQSYNTEL